MPSNLRALLTFPKVLVGSEVSAVLLVPRYPRFPLPLESMRVWPEVSSNFQLAIGPSATRALGVLVLCARAGTMTKHVAMSNCFRTHWTLFTMRHLPCRVTREAQPSERCLCAWHSCSLIPTVFRAWASSF